MGSDLGSPESWSGSRDLDGCPLSILQDNKPVRVVQDCGNYSRDSCTFQEAYNFWEEPGTKLFSSVLSQAYRAV